MLACQAMFHCVHMTCEGDFKKEKRLRVKREIKGSKSQALKATLYT